MADAPLPTVTREGARITCTLIFSDEERAAAEKQALERLGSQMEFPGFRPGKAPLEKVRERVKDDELFERTVRELVGPRLTDIGEKEQWKPIIPPRIEVTAREPLTVRMIVIDRPAVTVKGLEKITIEKKAVQADPKDVERVIQSLVRDEKAAKDAPVPELTDAFVLERFQLPSVAAFREAVEQSIRAQEEQAERLRQERAVLDAIRTHTTVDLPQELIDEEVRGLIDELAHDLQRQNQSIEEWLQKEKKSMQEMEKDLRARATDRLKFRFGMAHIIEEKKIAVSDDEMKTVIDREVQRYPDAQREQVRSALVPGGDAYGEIRWRMMVEKVLTALLAQ